MACTDVDDRQFGSPHYGIASPIPCPARFPSPQCLLAARAAKIGIYRPWSQTHLVQAQYYRDPARMEEYLRENTFIRDMIGEGKYLAGEEDGDGGMGVAGLENFVAVMFDKDREYCTICQVSPISRGRLGSV